jgi:cystathionine beta-synthase
VTVGPDDTLQVAYARMKLYDVSQLPVLEGDRVVGLIDESDLLLAVFERGFGFHDPVRAAMVTDIETVEANRPIQALLPEFDKGFVAVIVDGPHFLGLITRIDLLNHLRRRKEQL